MTIDELWVMNLEIVSILPFNIAGRGEFTLRQLSFIIRLFLSANASLFGIKAIS
jgi:hypothetical protein